MCSFLSSGGGSFVGWDSALLDWGCCFGWLLMEDSLDVIYGYTEASLKDAVASLNGLNTRLVAVTGVTGFLLRFALDVKLERLRWGITLAVAVCIVACMVGLAAKDDGLDISPRRLVDGFWEDPISCKKQILSNWIETLDRLDEKRAWKASCLNAAVGCLLVAISFLAIVVVIGQGCA